MHDKLIYIKLSLKPRQCFSASAMFEILRAKLNHTSAMPHFLSLLHHCLLLPLDYGASPQHWLLFDRIVQQVHKE